MQRTIIFLACFFVCSAIHAQQTNLSFQHYTMQDGLSDNYIRGLFQDNRGFLWISTYEGLNRFDGQDFKKFYHNEDDSTTISSNISDAVIHSKKDELIIRGNFKFSVFNTTKQKFSVLRRKEFNGILSCISRDKNNHLWFAYYDHLLRTDSAFVVKKKYEIDQDYVKMTIGVHRLNDQQLVLVTFNNIFFLNEADGSLHSLKEVFPELKKILYLSYSFYNGQTNTLYAGGWTSGLFKIDFNSSRVSDLQLINKKGKFYFTPANTVFRDSKNRLWVGTNDGLLLLNETTGGETWFHESKDNDGLTGNFITCLLEDDEKNIWIGTSNGMNKLSDASQIIHHYKKEFEKKGSQRELYDVTSTSKGDIIIATYGNGLFKLDETAKTANPLPQSFMNYTWFVNEIEGMLYVGGHEQLISASIPAYKFSPTNFLKPFYKKTNLVLLAYKDKAGDTWYSLNGNGGLVRYISSQKRYVQYNNEQIPQPFRHDYFNAVTEDEEGNLWWGVNKFQNVIKWDRQKQNFREISFPAILKNTERTLAGINCLYYEKGGHLWVGTDGTGLFDLDIKTLNLREYTVNKGLIGENIAFIISDKKKRLWLGTKKGLSCLLPDRKTFLNFTISDGLPELIFNDGVCWYDSLVNKLYLGTQHSLLVFNPDEVVSRTLGPARIYLDEIFINGIKNYDAGQKSIRLKYDQNNLQFNFSAIEFNNASSLQLEFRLEGLNKEWVDAGNQRSITFLNLDNGKYVFKLRVKKRGSDNWNETSATFPIIILPPWWQTWWFRLGFGVLITGLLIIIFSSYYKRRLEHQQALLEKQQAVEKERSRIASDMHDDLGAGLTKIKFITENISEKIQSGESVLPELQNLKSSSSELIESMGEIIWAMSEKNNLLSDTLYYLRSYAVNYCEENYLACHFELPEKFNNIIVSGNIRRNIFLLLKECLHNIVKHAAAKTVNIKISLSQNLELNIKDNGKGFSETRNTAKGNGLINMRKRVNELDGSISFENRNGTTVIIKLPLSTNQSTIE